MKWENERERDRQTEDERERENKREKENDRERERIKENEREREFQRKEIVITIIFVLHNTHLTSAIKLNESLY